jgi:hypothetical protein
LKVDEELGNRIILYGGLRDAGSKLLSSLAGYGREVGSAWSRRGKVLIDLYNVKSRSAIETEKQDARHLPIMVDAGCGEPDFQKSGYQFRSEQTNMSYTCLGLEASFSSFSLLAF